LNSPPPSFSISLPHIPRIVSTGLSFPFLYMKTFPPCSPSYTPSHLTQSVESQNFHASPPSSFPLISGYTVRVWDGIEKLT
jgi:hypothetical protein